MTRIILIHAYMPSIEPIASEFQTRWPQAETLNLLDESLYADVSQDGVLPSGMESRIATLIRHAEASGAHGIVFTGSTFGPAIEIARLHSKIPVLKADEALCIQAVARGERILIACTARRALPVILDNLQKTPGFRERGDVETLCIEKAKEALVRGETRLHDQIIADALEEAGSYSTILLGQISMTPARRLLSPNIAARTLAGPEATVIHLRSLLESAAKES